MSFVKKVEYHEVKIRFTVSAKELATVMENGLRPEHRDALRDGEINVPGALNIVVYEALTGNETGCMDIEDYALYLDGLEVDPDPEAT